MITTNIITLVYIISSILFILGIKRLSSPKTARSGNLISSLAMFLAILITILDNSTLKLSWIIIGLIVGASIGILMAKLVKMTAMPQMVALFNGFGGLASALISSQEFTRLANIGKFSIYSGSTIILSVIIGTITFTGSIIAFLKLQELIPTNPILIPFRNILNFFLLIITISIGFILLLTNTHVFIYYLIILGLLLGILIVIPIGGADMPVVIALLNSYSGIAAAFTGFALNNTILIICGSLVGASGLILTKIMTKAMNRSLMNVITGGFGQKITETQNSISQNAQTFKSINTVDTAILLEYSENIIIVPGYGLAVAQAQHSIKELSEILESKGCNIKYAIHPVAGRMPGHMNVLLAEANISYDKLYDLQQINDQFVTTDVAIVIGANDVTNPDARNNKNSPIYGMPILNVDKAKNIIVLKRSMNTGFSGIDNKLFYIDKTSMLFGDAKDSIEGITRELKES
jgi:NAD(P) transhydrogenase subunit beta